MIGREESFVEDEVIEDALRRIKETDIPFRKEALFESDEDWYVRFWLYSNCLNRGSFHRFCFLLPKEVGRPQAWRTAYRSYYSYYSYSYCYFSYSFSFTYYFAPYFYSFLSDSLSSSYSSYSLLGMTNSPLDLSCLRCSFTSWAETALTFIDMPNLRLCCGLFKWVI